MNTTITRIIVGAVALFTAALTLFGQAAPQPAFASGAGLHPAVFTLVSSNLTAAVFVPVSEPECVRLAAADLVSDTKKITGKAPAIVRRAEDCGANCVVLATLDRPESAALLEKLAPGFGDGLKGKWEAYRVENVGTRLIIAGSDERGTMFGLYAFIRIGFDTPKLASAWIGGKMRDGELLHPQESQCIGADVSLGLCGEISPGGDE